MGITVDIPGSFTFWYYLPDQDTYVTWNLNSVGTMQGVQNFRSSVLSHLKEQGG